MSLYNGVVCNICSSNYRKGPQRARKGPNATTEQLCKGMRTIKGDQDINIFKTFFKKMILIV